MPLNYDDIVNFRFNSFANGGVGEYEPFLIGYGANPKEERTVPNSAPYVLKLYEAPQENIPSTTLINEKVSGDPLREIAKTRDPAAGEFAVNYDARGIGDVRFNSAQAGLVVEIAYYGLGHIMTKDSLDTRVPSTGNTTIAGIKTFSDGAQGVYDNSAGEALRLAVVPIGDWDMANVGSVTINHGIADYAKIRDVSVMIRMDAAEPTVRYRKLNAFTDAADPALIAGGVQNINPANMVLIRRTGGLFDGVQYNQTSYNRGWIKIWYEA